MYPIKTYKAIFSVIYKYNELQIQRMARLGGEMWDAGCGSSRRVLEGSEEVASVRMTECSRFQIPSCHWRMMILCSGVRAPIQLLPQHQGTRNRDPAGQSGPGTGRQCDRCQCQNDSDRDGRVPNV